VQEDAAVESSVAIERSSRVEQKVVERSSLEFWLPLLCILVLASFLRLYALSIYPQRFNQDEMLLGYDAWSIWTTGHDHHGAFLPIFFRSYNDYNPPVANYIAALFVGILGLSEFSTRLPFALMGIVTIFLVALLGRRWFNSATGLVAALLLTIDPWHVNFSRVAFPSSCVPFFTVVSLYCFTRGTSLFAMKEQKGLTALLWLVGSALSFALLTGSYSTMKLEAPLLLCACAFAVIPCMRNNLSRLGWTDFLIWLALYGLLVSPLAITQLQGWYQIQTRFNHLTIINQPNWLILFFFEYIAAYSLYLLSFAGFGGSVAVYPQGVGNLFWLEGVLFIFALIGILKNRYCSRQVGFSMRILLVVWLMTFPIASSLTIHSPHDVRTYNFLPLPEILAGYGAVVAWDIVGRYRWLWFSVGMVVLLLFNWVFLSFYFSAPLLQTDVTADQFPYNVGLKPVLTTVMQQVKPCDTVWLEPATDRLDNQTYMYYLFLMRYPPSRFQSSRAQEVDTQLDLYTSVGQVHFAIPGAQESLVSLPAGCKGKPSRTFFITRTALAGPEWQQIVAVRNHAGVAIWQGLVKRI
jgi:4-amino-4-deoxy-L-arabinose transferase-like glycosyltransferase